MSVKAPGNLSRCSINVHSLMTHKDRFKSRQIQTATNRGQNELSLTRGQNKVPWPWKRKPNSDGGSGGWGTCELSLVYWVEFWYKDDEYRHSWRWNLIIKVWNSECEVDSGLIYCDWSTGWLDWWGGKGSYKDRGQVIEEAECWANDFVLSFEGIAGSLKALDGGVDLWW